MELTDRQFRALRALGRITAGEETFLNVTDADELAVMGLADRLGKGQFVLTDAGHEILNNLAAKKI